MGRIPLLTYPLRRGTERNSWDISIFIAQLVRASEAPNGPAQADGICSGQGWKQQQEGRLSPRPFTGGTTGISACSFR